MSQTAAPREYKFVGPFSRKRRRCNVAVAVSKDSAAISPSVRDKPATIDTKSARRSANKTKNPSPTQFGQIPSTEGTNNPVVIPPANLTNSEIPVPIPQPSVDSLGPVQDPDWSCSNFMHPSFELEFPILPLFSSCDGSTQLPVNVNVDDGCLELDDVNATDDICEHQGSPSDVRRPAAEIAFVSSTDDVLVPSCGAQGASYSIRVTISDLLTQYDREFCIMPLTHDFEANPFRVNTKTGRGSQLLLHCILALSYKHINRDTGSYEEEARAHKKKALQMLRDFESASQSTAFEGALLDAVLILMTLDCATSAHGPWTWYLKRAHRMLEAADFTHMKKTPRVEACIDILIWWDVTLALTSRQGCVLPHNTIASLFSQQDSRNETFYSVSGCPEPLFQQMIRLGSYAREFEVASNMTCVKLDFEPVLKVERQIIEWSDSDFGKPDISELPSMNESGYGDAMQHKEDLHHCAEAWRYGLLIYIQRVFKWQRSQAAPPVITFLARKTLDHVSNCRKTSMLQKQLLLPVFLAGCETQDRHLREVARNYCIWWNDQTRYDMFLTTQALLEEVWSNLDPHSWWGSIIDEKSRSQMSGGTSDGRQYLFG